MDDLRKLLHTCILRLGQTEGKRYFSLLMSKAENDLFNEQDVHADILLDVESRYQIGDDAKAEIEELPVVAEQDDNIPVLESV